MDDRNWNEYWRILFNKVTLDDIKNFEKKYKNSGRFISIQTLLNEKEHITIFYGNLEGLFKII